MQYSLVNGQLLDVHFEVSVWDWLGIVSNNTVTTNFWGGFPRKFVKADREVLPSPNQSHGQFDTTPTQSHSQPNNGL